MAKVVLLDSPSWLLFNPRQFLHLGILYLAGSLRAAGHDVTVLDCHEITNWDKENHRLIIHHDKLTPCDILGISATTANCHWGKQLAKAWPAAVKVLGGSHATYILRGPHERFKTPEYFDGFDYIILEEAEETFVRFCNGERETCPNLCWFDSAGKLRRNPPAGLPDVQRLAGPAFDLWPSQFFGGGLSLAGKVNLNEAMTASLFTARGCPYGCRFCADARTKIREESLEQIESELKMLATIGVTAIRIQDDVPTIKAERCRQLCDLLHQYGMKWRVNTRVNLTDVSLFKYMRDRGCIEVAFGVEHGSARMLKLMAKGTTPEKNTESIKMVQDIGMFTKAFLMVGFPGESDESIEEMKKWIIDTKPDACAWCMFQPYPGSDVWNRPEAYGVTLPDNAFNRFWQLGLEGTDDELILDLPDFPKYKVFKARQEIGELIDREIGHRDRRRLDNGGLGGQGVWGKSAEPMMA